MPRRDKTGPMGQGPMTGRNLGFCAGNDTPGMARNFGRGTGFGQGIGRGMGRGMRAGMNQGLGRRMGLGSRGILDQNRADITRRLEELEK